MTSETRSSFLLQCHLSRTSSSRRTRANEYAYGQISRGWRHEPLLLLQAHLLTSRRMLAQVSVAFLEP